MSARENINLFDCQVCYTRYNEGNHKPKYLSCHDTMCFSCISQIMDSESLRIKCPFCCKWTELETIAIDKALRTNYDILGFMAIAEQVPPRKLSSELMSTEEWCCVCQEKAADVCQDNNHCTVIIPSTTLSKAKKTVDRYRLSLANWEQAVVERNNFRMIGTSIQRSINRLKNRVDNLLDANYSELATLSTKVNDAKLAISNFDPSYYNSDFENLVNDSKHDLLIAKETLDQFSSLEGATVSILLKSDNRKPTEAEFLSGAICWKDNNETEKNKSTLTQDANVLSLGEARNILGYFVTSYLESEIKLPKENMKKCPASPPPIPPPKPVIRTTSGNQMQLRNGKTVEIQRQRPLSLLSQHQQHTPSSHSNEAPMPTQLSARSLPQREAYTSLHLNSPMSTQLSAQSLPQREASTSSHLNSPMSTQLSAQSLPQREASTSSDLNSPMLEIYFVDSSTSRTQSLSQSSTAQLNTSDVHQRPAASISHVDNLYPSQSIPPIPITQNIATPRTSVSSVPQAGSLTPIPSNQNVTPPVPAARTSISRSITEQPLSKEYTDTIAANQCLSTCAWNPVANILAATKRNEPACLLSGLTLANSITLEFDRTSTGSRSSTETLSLKDQMHRLAWNSEGSQLVVGSTDGWIHFWTSSGKSILRQKQHAGEILAMKYNLNGKFLATGGLDKIIKVWNVTDKVSIRTFHFHDAPVWDIDWHSSEKFASCSLDGKMFFCDVGLLNKPVYAYTGHQGWVKCLHWDPEHFLLASCSIDSTIKIWTQFRPNFLQQYNDTKKYHSQSVNAVQWSPTGPLTNYPNANRYLASCSDDQTALILDITKEEAIHKLETKTKLSKMTCLSFSPDGKLLATGNDKGAVEIWNVHNGRIVNTFANFGSSVRKLDWEKYGTKLGVTFYERDYMIVEIRK